MPQVYHARHEQAKRLTRKNAAGCLHKRRVNLLVHAIPIMQFQSQIPGLEWNDETKLSMPKH